MATLTQTAIVTRKIIRYSIYGVILIFVGGIFLNTSIGIYRYFFPKAPPPPTVLFNKLTKIPFPDNRADPAKLTYSIETPQGGLPKFSSPDKPNLETTQLPVYFMPRNVSNLFSVQEGLNKARLLGFTTQGQEESETLYKFKHQSVPKTLEINVVSNVFSLSYDLAADTSPIESIPPMPDVAASAARSYLSAAGILPEDLKKGPTSHRYLKVEQGKLVEVSSLSQAQLTEIHLFRTNYNGLPSIGPDQGEANVWFLMSGSPQTDKKILAGEFHYLNIDTQRVSTYPIINAATALEKLKTGKGYIVKAPGEGNVVIRKVYLAYYDPEVSTDFYQPIVVFEGDNFTAYVPAVTNEYYPE